MPCNKRKRQHEGNKDEGPAITYNTAEIAEYLANDIKDRHPKAQRGPCVHCKASGGATVQQPGLDLTESCIDSANMSGREACPCSRLSAGVPSDVSAWPDSCLRVGCICELFHWERQSSRCPLLCGCGRRTSSAACADCDQPCSRGRCAHQTAWLTQQQGGDPALKPVLMAAGQVALRGLPISLQQGPSLRMWWGSAGLEGQLSSGSTATHTKRKCQQRCGTTTKTRDRSLCSYRQ